MADKFRPEDDAPRKERPLAYDFEEKWDAEAAIRRKNTQTPQPEPRGSVPERPAPYPPRTSRPAREPYAYTPRQTPERREKKRRVNVRGWTILIALILAALLLLTGLIWLIVWAVSPGEADEKPGTSEQVPESTQSPQELAEEILARAEPLALTYDYDGAIQILSEFGTNWQSQPQLAAANTRYTAEKEKLVRWGDTTQISHIFFHSLIMDSARAFDGEGDTDGYNQYMVTAAEFEMILDSLYERGFVLVRIHDIVKQTTNAAGETVYEQGDIYLPPGKTPIVMSQDDVNYYDYMVDGDGDGLPDAGGDGFAHKMIIGSDGYPTCEYYTPEGQLVTGEYDLVPILERFIQEHPDFSYRGARAILAVTGYQGVFGYRTHPKYEEALGEEAYAQEVRDAQALVTCLREKGWEIASHSFGHPSYASYTAEELATDVQKWENQVQPITGDTDIMIYAHGSDIAGVEDYSGAKFESMYAAGYRFFCNVDSAEYWVQIHDTYVRQGRRNIDGYRMWWNPELLDDLFDVEAVFDAARPTPVPSIV